MRDVDLLVFDGYDDLAGRLLPGAVDGMPRGKVLVHHALDPKGARAILVEAIGQPLGSPAGVKRLKGRLDPEANRVLTTRALLERVLFTVERTESHDTLLRALRPSPSAEAPALDRDSHVIAWCADAGRFSLLVQECLALGCDRIRFTPLGDAVLARIDAPPWYFLERWTRPDADLASIYVPGAPPAGPRPNASAERFYTRWGWEHPLSGRLAVSENEIVLADPDGRLHRAPASEWRDVYDALAISADGLTKARWAPADPAPRFTVKLKLAHTTDPVEPELWLLRRTDLPAVERLLGVMPEADLKHLAVAFFDVPQIPAAGADDEPVAAMREVITGRGRGWVDFGGTGFRALPGLPNLYLPVDRALDPQVRRDRIAEAFELKGGEFSVVREGMRAVRIAESAFRPLSSYIDYVVTGAASRLQALVNATVFDAGPLAELTEAPADVRVRKDPEPPKTVSATSIADGGRAEPRVPSTDPISTGDESPEPQLPVEEKPAISTEQQVEARIALDPPGLPADWMELGELRRARGDVDGAVECWENARWLDRARDAEMRRLAIAALEGSLQIGQTTPAAGRPALALARSDGPGDVRALRLRALYLEEGSVPEATHLPEYYAALYTEARAAQAADRLRKKTRWLVWSAVLSRNRDDIELERQREAILADLNQTGLAPMDRADFVRARLAERAVDGGDSGELRRTLEGLTERLQRIEDVRVRWSGVALLARRWAELDDAPRARKLAQDAIGAMAEGATAASARIHANAAVALLRTRDGTGVRAFVKALDIVSKLANAEDRGRTLFGALESLSSVSDPVSVRSLVDGALAQLEKEDPRRSALFVARCAPALRKLEAGPRARSLALRLAQDQKVQRDAHYFSGAVSGLAQLQGTRPLPPAVLNPILDAVRSQQSLEEMHVRLFEGAVSLAGERFAREISDSLKRTPPGEVRFAQIITWAAALQGLAAARAADTGLQDLDRALRVAWQLPNDDERRRSVKRLTSVIPLFGRVNNGLALVQEVVRRVAAPSVGPYFKSEVLTACVEVAARLGARQGAFDVMDQIIELVETTARTSPGDVTFLFDVLGLCVDHAVTIGASRDSIGIINRVAAFVEENMDESSSRYWTPFYRYKALAKCARGYARLGNEEMGMPILTRILDRAADTAGLDRIDLLREIVLCLSEIGGGQRLALVDRVLDAMLGEPTTGIADSGIDLLGQLLDEVVSPASRVRAEYARYLGSEERNIRERVANDRVVS